MSSTKTKMRVAAIVFQMKGNKPLIALHVPVKSDMVEDYSLTTITEKLYHNQNAFSVMANAVHLSLNINRSDIVDEKNLPDAASEAKGKQYSWFLMQIEADKRIEHNRSRIQDLFWVCPKQLPMHLPQMSDDRRKMFLAALENAVKITPALEAFQGIVREMRPEQLQLQLAS